LAISVAHFPSGEKNWSHLPPVLDDLIAEGERSCYSHMNDIDFPAGVLQPLVFGPKMDDAPHY
jgi:hypothetical protein